MSHLFCDRFFQDCYLRISWMERKVKGKGTLKGRKWRDEAGEALVVQGGGEDPVREHKGEGWGKGQSAKIRQNCWEFSKYLKVLAMAASSFTPSGFSLQFYSMLCSIVLWSIVWCLVPPEYVGLQTFISAGIFWTRRAPFHSLSSSEADCQH